MNKKSLGLTLLGAGIGYGIGWLVQQFRINRLMKANDELAEAYIRTNVEAALELHKDDWTFTDEEKAILNRAGFNVQ